MKLYRNFSSIQTLHSSLNLKEFKPDHVNKPNNKIVGVIKHVGWLIFWLTFKVGSKSKIKLSKYVYMEIIPRVSYTATLQRKLAS